MFLYIFKFDIQKWSTFIHYVYSDVALWWLHTFLSCTSVMSQKKKGGGGLYIFYISWEVVGGIFSAPKFWAFLLFLHGCPYIFTFIKGGWAVPLHILYISWRWCHGGSYIFFHISWRWCSGGSYIFFTSHEGGAMAAHTYFFTSHEGGAVGEAYIFFFFYISWGGPDCRIGAYIPFYISWGGPDCWIGAYMFFFYISWGGAGLPDWSIHIFLHFMRGCRIAGLEHTYFFLHFMRRDQKWRWRQKWRRRQVKENGSPYSSAVSIHRLPCRIDAFISLFV